MKNILIVALVLWLPGAVGAADKPKPVKVFILAGQSNMEGKAKLMLLNYQAQQPATRDLFKHLRKDGRWIEREDVWIKFLNRKGKLTVGYGSPQCIGPEPDRPGRPGALAAVSQPSAPAGLGSAQCRAWTEMIAPV